MMGRIETSRLNPNPAHPGECRDPDHKRGPIAINVPDGLTTGTSYLDSGIRRVARNGG